MDNLSEKFSVIIEKFLIWTNENDYSLFSKDCNSKVEWDIRLLSDFKEPGRNKLETFVKKLSKEYLLTKDNEKVLDIKLMVNSFKETKSKVTCSIKSKTVDVVKEKKCKVKNEKTKEKKQKTESIYIDFDLDTSNTYNIDTLEYFTEDLVKVFGRPKEIIDEDSKYEWKVNVNGDVYSIYDWMENKEKFDDITWYLAVLNEDKNNINKLYNYIDEKIKNPIDSKESENIEFVNTNIKLNEKEDLMTDKKDLLELFGEDSAQESEEDEEINLDIISDTLEIDIDNLDF